MFECYFANRNVPVGIWKCCVEIQWQFSDETIALIPDCLVRSKANATEREIPQEYVCQEHISELETTWKSLREKAGQERERQKPVCECVCVCRKGVGGQRQDRWRDEGRDTRQRNRDRRREREKIVTELEGSDFREEDHNNAEGQRACMTWGPESWSVSAFCGTLKGFNKKRYFISFCRS